MLGLQHELLMLSLQLRLELISDSDTNQYLYNFDVKIVKNHSKFIV